MLRRELSLFAWFVFAAISLGADYVVPKQTIVGSEKPIPIGELVEISLSPINESPPNFIAASYTWTVLDGYTEMKVKTCQNGVIFGTGTKSKKLLVLCAATYVYATKDAQGVVKEHGTKTVMLRAEVTIGGGVPPDPIPPPQPDDPLFPALKSAWLQETDAQKTKRVKDLAALYRQAGSLSVKNQEIKTWGELFDVMDSASGTLGVKGTLPLLQKALAVELLAKQLPVKRDAVLDAAGRDLAEKTFLRGAALLEALP